mgnify:CR=1 FL=1
MSKRFICVLPLAAIATAGLFGVMITLIDGEWAPQESVKDLKFDINPVVDEPRLIRRTVQIEKIKKVETPPPPQRIATQNPIQPKEPIAEQDWMIPDFSFDDMDISTDVALNIDSDEKAILRVPPQMPTRAERSGHCVARFDINAEGAPFNITTPYCTQDVFSRPTLKAVAKWKYRPAVQDGTAQTSRSVETKVVFKLADENGRLIPE